MWEYVVADWCGFTSNTAPKFDPNEEKTMYVLPPAPCFVLNEWLKGLRGWLELLEGERKEQDMGSLL